MPLRTDVPVTTAKFLASVENFLAEHHIAISVLGRRAIGDPSFVTEVRMGRRSPTLDTAHRVLAWMKDYQEGKNQRGADQDRSRKRAA